jgi:hypothetical protein
MNGIIGSIYIFFREMKQKTFCFYKPRRKELIGLLLGNQKTGTNILTNNHEHDCRDTHTITLAIKHNAHMAPVRA